MSEPVTVQFLDPCNSSSISFKDDVVPYEYDHLTNVDNVDVDSPLWVDMSLFGPSAGDSLKLNLKDKSVFLNYVTGESLCGKIMFEHTTSPDMSHVTLIQPTGGPEFFNLDYTTLPTFSTTGRSYTLTLIAYYEFKPLTVAGNELIKASKDLVVTEFDCSMRFDVVGGLSKD